METLAPTGYSYLNIEAEFDETLQKNKTKRWQDTISLKNHSRLRITRQLH